VSKTNLRQRFVFATPPLESSICTRNLLYSCRSACEYQLKVCRHPRRCFNMNEETAEESLFIQMIVTFTHSRGIASRLQKVPDSRICETLNTMPRATKRPLTNNHEQPIASSSTMPRCPRCPQSNSVAKLYKTKAASASPRNTEQSKCPLLKSNHIPKIT
jgi:hypothetical protein